MKYNIREKLRALYGLPTCEEELKWKGSVSNIEIYFTLFILILFVRFIYIEFISN